MHFDVCVLGLGYIGLPTAVLLADAGLQVLGVDIDKFRIEALRNQNVNLAEPELGNLLKSTVASDSLCFSEVPQQAGAFIVAVPTPLMDEKQADLDFVYAAIDSIIPVLRANDLVVIESTCPPRTTQAIAQRIRDQRPDLNNEFHLAYCPERILPGDAIAELWRNDRTIGGLTKDAAHRASDLYSKFCNGEFYITDATTAETVKLVENAYRDVNVAFANELSLIAERLGVNAWEVITLANRHPRVNVLNPGPGVGGHCIAVDPWFLAGSAPTESRLIRAAREVNSSKPNWVVQQVEKQFENDFSSVLLLGLAYKPNIDDLRESPSVKVAQKLAQRNPTLDFIAIEPNLGSAPENFETFNLKWSPKMLGLENFDIAVWLVDHNEFKGLNFDDFSGPLLDFRGPETRTHS